MNQALAEKCRRSFYFFVQFMWDTIIAEEPVWNWHIKYLCEELQEIGLRVKARLPKEFDYYIINVPPGSSKSTIVSEMYPLWCWTVDPTQRFICGSYASTPAEDIASKCYNIYHSEKFCKLFPELHTKKAKGGKTHFENGLKGERYTTSTGSAITGVHAHQLIVDDPMNPKIAASKVERESANKWVSETLSTRKVNKAVTVTIIVMQRLHHMDTTGYLLKKEGLRIKHICIPAELSDKLDSVKPVELKKYYQNGLFDPIRAPREVLQSIKLELGSFGYAGQMQQRPSPEEGGTIKRDWFKIVKRDKVPPYTVADFQMDTAYTDDTANDPTAMLTYYVENNDLYIVNAVSVWKEFPELIEWIPKHHERFAIPGRSRIYVEPKATGKSVIQTIKRLTNLNIISSEPPKEDKLTRLTVESPKIEAGRVILHEGPWNESFIDQVCSFPNADHDDEMDCMLAVLKRCIAIKKDNGTNKNVFSGFR